MIMLPEIILVCGAVLLLAVDLVLNERRRIVIAPLAFAITAASLAELVVAARHNGSILGGNFEMDAVAWWFKLIILISAAVVILLSIDLLDGRTGRKVPGIGSRGEFYTVLLFTVTGVLYLVSARELVTMYVSLELATIPLFLLAAWKRDDVRSGEAGLKYVITGALASALLLYGLGLLYGLCGSMRLAHISSSAGVGPGIWLAAALIVAGVGFKMTMVPFHFWAADVYEGSPLPVTAYLSVVSKGAALVMLFHVFYRLFSGFVADWSLLIAILAAVTMTVGNLAAILQPNIKRFMAFSAVSQAGYLLMGFVGLGHDGTAAMLFYMLVYAISNLLVFACIIWHSNETGSELISDYNGLSRTNPMLALAMMLGLFSLAGIPPLSGFVGKFFLFSVASGRGMHWLVAFAAVNSTVSLYYYLRIVRAMYIEDPAAIRTVRTTPVLAATVFALSIGTVMLGLVPHCFESIKLAAANW